MPHLIGGVFARGTGRVVSACMRRRGSARGTISTTGGVCHCTGAVASTTVVPVPIPVSILFPIPLFFSAPMSVSASIPTASVPGVVIVTLRASVLCFVPLEDGG